MVCVDLLRGFVLLDHDNFQNSYVVDFIRYVPVRNTPPHDKMITTVSINDRGL